MNPEETRSFVLEELPPSGTFGGRISRESTFGCSRSLQVSSSLFYCHKSALVIEVDGDVHDMQKKEDEWRERVLSALGLRIVRFGNDEVMRRLSAVVGKIRELLKK